MTVKDAVDLFDLSDEDFAKLPASTGEEGAAAPSVASVDEPVVETPPVTDEPVAEEPTAAEIEAAKEDETDDEKAAREAAEAADKAAAEDDDNPLGSDDAELKQPKTDAEKAKEAADKVEADKKAETDKAAAEAAKVPATPATPETAQVAVEIGKAGKDQKPEALAGFFDKVMAPLKANGKDIKITSPEDVIRLMQMGAGYGKKIQDMQPAMKSLRMLEKNNLLDEGKLSYLIDLDKKNPEAIKKLIKDSGIDPLDLNMDEDTKYSPTNHSVSDTEVTFVETLKEVQDLKGGPELIQHINKDWDQDSKNELFKTPAIMTALHAQRETGVYTLISEEIDRQKMLGTIPRSTPFLEAYKIAGDHLVSERQKQQPQATATPAQVQAAQPEAKVLATRTAAPKPAATNTDRAKAAASNASNRKPAKVVVNPLDMADDDFLKEFKFS